MKRGYTLYYGIQLNGRLCDGRLDGRLCVKRRILIPLAAHLRPHRLRDAQPHTSHLKAEYCISRELVLHNFAYVIARSTLDIFRSETTESLESDSTESMLPSRKAKLAKLNDLYHSLENE